MSDPKLTVCQGLLCRWNIEAPTSGLVFNLTFAGERVPGDATNDAMLASSVDITGNGRKWFTCQIGSTPADCEDRKKLSLSRRVQLIYVSYADEPTVTPTNWQLQLVQQAPPACNMAVCDPIKSASGACSSDWPYYETQTCTATYDTTAENTAKVVNYPFISFLYLAQYCGLDGVTQTLNLYSGNSSKSALLARLVT